MKIIKIIKKSMVAKGCYDKTVYNKTFERGDLTFRHCAAVLEETTLPLKRTFQGGGDNRGVYL